LSGYGHGPHVTNWEGSGLFYLLRTRLRRVGLITAASLIAVVITAGSAFASSTITLQNAGTQPCTSDTTSFHFVLNGVDNSAALSSTSISVTFVQSGSTTPYTVSSNVAPVVNLHEVSWTITQTDLLGLLQTAYKSAGFTLAIVQTLVVSAASITLPAGVTANNFVLSSCPLPSSPGGNIPEVPLAILYPLLGILTLGGVYAVRRFRRGASSPAAV
jgi:hypothetical protein